MDDNYKRMKKNEADKFSIDLNSYHEKIKLMLEINLKQFLDIEIIRTLSRIFTQRMMSL